MKKEYQKPILSIFDVCDNDVIATSSIEINGEGTSGGHNSRPWTGLNIGSTSTSTSSKEEETEE